MNTFDVVVPLRFAEQVSDHVVLNLLDADLSPLVLGVFGRPGDGKSYQVRHLLEAGNVRQFTINAADLESDRAGQPGKRVLETYVIASREISRGRPAALVIDDIDTTVGEWAQNTGTVNHQQVLAQLMHLADRPSYVEDVGDVRRVPIIVTGNDFTKLYSPLRRPGRMVAFHWACTVEERITVVAGIYGSGLERAARELVLEFSSMPTAFFAQVRQTALRSVSGRLIQRLSVDLPALAHDPGRYLAIVRADLADPRNLERALHTAAHDIARNSANLTYSYLSLDGSAGTGAEA